MCVCRGQLLTVRDARTLVSGIILQLDMLKLRQGYSIQPMD
jgi:hypothetical protein